MLMPPEKLVIIDYCGTLSLAAPRFGRPDHLTRALDGSGLAALGVSTPEIFWEKIVDPTWIEGSTTSIGYAKVMAGRIASLDLAPGAPTAAIESAACRFVDLYLAASRIDPHWRPALTGLSGHPAAVTAVSTDHYAEATGMIIGYLDSWGIPARRSGRGKPSASPPASGFLVANSADLGALKESRRFWEILKSQLPPSSVRRILLIDDFGSNEAPGDSYGAHAQVTTRREKVIANIDQTFQAAVDVVPFELHGPHWGSEEAGAALIDETAAVIGAFLERRA
ncbi:MAG: hypothetical protein AB1558_11825 [Thermodesulfobacteriota bacterium]